MADLNIRPPLETKMHDASGNLTPAWRQFFGTFRDKINEALSLIEVSVDAEIVDLNITGKLSMDDVTLIDSLRNLLAIKDIEAEDIVAETLVLSGDAAITGDVTVGGDLDVTGDVAGATATIAGDAGVGSLTSTGAVSGTDITGDSLDVTGEVEGATLNITSDADIAGDLEVTDGVNIGGALDYKGTAGVSGGDLRVAGDGYFDGYVRTMASKYGRGLDVREYNPTTTLAYDIGATFTASTATISKAGQTFVSDGVDIEDYLIVRDASDSSYIGATGEIISVTETTIVVSVAAAGSDTPSDLTGVDFTVHNHPLFFVLDNGDIHSRIGVSPDASFKIEVPESNNIHGIHFDVTSGVNGNHGVGMDYDPGTYGGCAAFRINADATALDDAADRLNVHSIVVENAGATGGQVHGMSLSVADSTNTDLETCAVFVDAGVSVISQKIGTPAAIVAAFSHTGSTYTDRTTAFGSAVTNVQLFGADNDYVYLASATKFDEVIVLLATPASRSITPTFEYVTDAGAWVAFVPVDSTNGFKQNGSIRYSSADLTTWGVRTINEVTGAVGADDYYWIRIRRTRNILPTPPTESTIQVLARGTDFSWDKAGNARVNTIGLTDGVTAPGAVVGQAFIYIDIADGDLKVKFGDGTVKTIAVDT